MAQDRLLRLQALQDELGAHWLAARVESRGPTTLLVEGPSPKPGASAEPSWQGRDPYGVPVHVPLPAGTDHTGRLVQASITEAKKHSLLAVCTGEPW